MVNPLIRIITVSAAAVLFVSVVLSVITQSTASLYTVSQSTPPNATPRPDNWVGPWTLCSDGKCNPLPIPCDKESFGEGPGLAFLIRQEYGDDESRLCSRLRATRAVFLVEGILGLISLLILLYALSAWSLRFYVAAAIGTMFTFFFNLALITILAIIRYNLNNLRDLAATDPLGDRSSSTISYSFGWGFWMTIFYTILTFLALVIMALGASCVRREKRKDDAAAARDNEKARQRNNRLEVNDDFITSPHPDRPLPMPPTKFIETADAYGDRFVDARQDIEETAKAAPSRLAQAADSAHQSVSTAATEAAEPIESNFAEGRRRVAEVATGAGNSARDAISKTGKNITAFANR
ncbi:hypothetical protein BC829DRAFT_397000 [Chytridium lagenaria]|nr:hypothetical protein BC829DRAFT_397000 [Chytridium lagenaria]